MVYLREKKWGVKCIAKEGDFKMRIGGMWRFVLALSQKRREK